ncbi:DNA-binding Lrp family transcriptional regulator [Mycolicibacterium moriokaense]|uniref:DNA-binding Lrp family transcriptional regulator n=2 Tax=Mycolicibacterium moriokaense TaxID=39691 RepID=A0A318H784_9MYCO|nr:DNA-binding Lrp family transcriptional regulator [Mycolicibacterium moriokaense]
MAGAFGVNEATIAARLRRLEAHNVVRVVALTDMHRLGFEYLAIGMVSVEARLVSQVAAEIAAIPQTIFVNVHTGRYGVSCGVLAEDRLELGRIFGEDIPRVRGVRAARCELAVDVLRFNSEFAPLNVSDQGVLCGPKIPPHAIDDQDLDIIHALQRDARASNRSIAADLAVSEGTVRARLRRMEANHLIRIRAISDLAAFGMDFGAFVGVRVMNGRIPEVADRLLGMDPIGVIIQSLGDWDFLLVILATTRDVLLDIVFRQIQGLDGVGSTEVIEIADVVKHLYTWARLV